MESPCKKMRNEQVAARELIQYRSLAGTLPYLGNGVLPQASYVVSLMQEKLGRLTVKHAIEANDTIRELRKMTPCITYPCVKNIKDVSLFAIKDAAHSKDIDYGQTGFIIGLVAHNCRRGSNLYSLVDWCSQKKQRNSHSSYGAEILPAAIGDDRGYYRRKTISTLLQEILVDFDLKFESKYLWDTIKTLHERRSTDSVNPSNA